MCVSSRNTVTALGGAEYNRVASSEVKRRPGGLGEPGGRRPGVAGEVDELHAQGKGVQLEGVLQAWKGLWVWDVGYQTLKMMMLHA